jgi:hypothetical protein
MMYCIGQLMLRDRMLCSHEKTQLKHSTFLSDAGVYKSDRSSFAVLFHESFGLIL